MKLFTGKLASIHQNCWSVSNDNLFAGSKLMDAANDPYDHDMCIAAGGADRSPRHAQPVRARRGDWRQGPRRLCRESNRCHPERLTFVGDRYG
jgi:hypothetical protein